MGTNEDNHTDKSFAAACKFCGDFQSGVEIVEINSIYIKSALDKTHGIKPIRALYVQKVVQGCNKGQSRKDNLSDVIKNTHL